MQALVWDEGEGLRTAEGPQAVAEAVRSGKSRVWCDITGPGDEEHQFLLGLGFHHLTLEDVQHYTPVPKLEEYTGYHFVVFHALGYDFDRHRVLTPEIHLYVGRNYLIAIHDEMLPPLEEAQHRIRAHPETILGRGIDFFSIPCSTPSSTVTCRSPTPGRKRSMLSKTSWSPTFD